ncbi:hypothetical protein [Chitinibacter sp. GC72]|uniref:hypothetical protein n=1 Tax=Chitinibacter sp. GC72 TaxID=1526917 RepID=UPI0012F937A2|nr:hypothetical protein [Chitinibacter sp. GC72]
MAILYVKPSSSESYAAYEQACDFLAAAERLQEKRLSREGDKFESTPLIPAVVCYLFSAEIFIKALFLESNGVATTGHKLETLFLELDPSIQQRIKSQVSVGNYPRIEGVPSATFESKLLEISNGFVKWRYAHEEQTMKSIDLNFVESFLGALKVFADSEFNLAVPSET